MKGAAEGSARVSSSVPDGIARAAVTKSAWVGVGLICVAVAIVRLIFADRPLSADEGGFLMVAAQWAPGRSLYGDYFVDRPPLLLLLFDVAALLGGTPLALRVLGVLAATATVAAAAWVGAELTAPDPAASGATTRRLCRTGRLLESGSVVAAIVAGLLVISPLMGALDVNGELLATPFVMTAAAAALHGSRAAVTVTASSRRLILSWGLAGAAAMAAILVKQNMWGGFVAAAAVGFVVWRRAPRRTAVTGAVGFAGGAASVLTVVLGVAVDRGTDLLTLFRAIVVFRGEAAAVIASGAPASNDARATRLLSAAAVSGIPLLVVCVFVAAWAFYRYRTRAAAVRDGSLGPRATQVLCGSLLTSSTVAVVGGGSYWLHYLVCLVPGLVLAAVCCTQLADGSSREKRLDVSSRAVAVTLAGALSLLLAVTASAVVTYAVRERPAAQDEEVAVSTWLARHARDGDTATVAFGVPSILQRAGLQSPYPQLWSLPVRVLDPGLREFRATITGPRPPEFLVTSGASVGTWGITGSAADAAQRDIDERYRSATAIGQWRIYVLDTGQVRSRLAAGQ